MFQRLKNKKGFTLVELVVVIAILGILAAIAVPRIVGFQERARAQADNQVASQVRNAVALLHANREIVLATGDIVFHITTTWPGGTTAYTLVSTDLGNMTVPTGTDDAAKFTPLQGLISGTNGLVRDIQLQNRTGRSLYVRLTHEGIVNAVLATATPNPWP